MLFRHPPGNRYEALKDDLLAACASPAESRYVTDRWLERLNVAHSAFAAARDYVYAGRFVSLGAATILPAVVSAQAAFRSGWWTVAAVPPGEHAPAFDRFRARVEGAIRGRHDSYV